MTWAVWFIARPTSLLLPTLMLLILLFPTGRFMPGRWGLLGQVTMAVEVAVCVLWVVVPQAAFDRGLPAPPDVDLDPTTLDVLSGIGPSLIPGARLVAGARVPGAGGRRRGASTTAPAASSATGCAGCCGASW